MKLHRIWAVMLRYLFLFRHNLGHVFDMFYWPVIDLLVWGLTSTYFSGTLESASGMILAVVAGIVFWLIIWRGQYEIGVSLLEDIWSRNLLNLFVAPLKFTEWVCAFLSMGILKSVVSFGFALLVGFLLYQADVLSVGLYIVPFAILLIANGWWVGFTVGGLILRYGHRIEAFAWSFVAMFAPFSAIYYPVSILPVWAQKVAMFVPSSYVFEGIREVLSTGTLDMNKLWISLGLTIVYLVLALLFFRTGFKRLLNRGLIQVF